MNFDTLQCRFTLPYLFGCFTHLFDTLLIFPAFFLNCGIHHEDAETDHLLYVL